MYESFYKLRAKPFRLSPDSGFFYPSRGHKRALAYLRYGLSQGEGFVVITGDPGTGKTTLAQILLKEMDQQHLVVAHLTTTQLEADEMLRMVSASFGLRYEGMDKAALLKTLEAFLLARARERKRALLVVDEAQNLPARSLEELRMLSNLQVGDRALLQTFLLGQPQFRQKLEHPDLEQLRQRVIANYHLSALAPDECRSYVESRLRQVGWQNDPSFTERAFESIYKYSEGVPRRINMLCDRVLLFSFLEEKHEVNNAILHQVTDELGQEVSGRPPSAERPAESLLHDDSFEVGSDVAEPAAQVMSQREGQEAVTATPAESFAVETPVPGELRGDSGEKAPAPDELHDSSEKLAAALREKARQAKEAAPQPAATARDAADTDPPPDVFELASAEQSLMEPAAGRAGAADDDGKASVPDDSVLDRAVPDDSWTRPVPQVDPDETDGGPAKIAAEAGSAEKPLDEEAKSGQQDRFRVIPGGRGTDTDKRQPVVLAPLPDAPGDTEEVTTRKILRLVLAFHRSPRSFPGLDDSTQPLPRGVRNILQLAVSDDEVLRDLRQISVMGISPAMLRAAVRFFVRRVMFVPGSDDYRVLGLQQGASLTEVEINYGLLMRLLRHDNAGVVDSGVSRIGAAYEHLCRGEQRPASGTGSENPALSDIEAIDNIGDLDLDVAPKAPDAINISMPQAASAQRDAFVEIDDGNSGVHIRHVVLVSCLVVVLLVLYVTQIRDRDSRVPVGMTPAEPAHQVVPGDPSSAAVPALGRADNRHLQDPAMAEDMPVPSPEARSADTAGDAWQGAVSPVVRSDEQLASLASVQAEEEAKAQAAIEAARKEEIARQEEAARQAAAARKKAEEEAKAAAEARAVAEARARARAEEQARIQAEHDAKAKIEADARAAAAAERMASEREAALRSMSEVRPNNMATEMSQAAVVAGISETDLVRLVDRFLAHYENGDLNGIMSLFYSKARTDTQTTEEGIRTEYEKTFTTTDKRNMVFSDLSWKRDDTFARGRGKFQATILPAGAGTPVLTSGKVTLQVTKGDAGLQISRLYFSDMKTVEGSQPAASNPPLSEADLNPLMTALVAYYEAGDIDAFMDLFSSDASSNDRSTAAGIREDYQSLFDSTVARRMELQNLRWVLEGGVARGESDYVVEVQTEKHGGVDVYRGTLWVQVEPRKGLARIVHFAFVE